MWSSNLVGQILLNRFRVESFIAAGGMGAVYKVWDTQRSVYLAMKVLHSELAEDSAAFRRFKREADNLKSLAHPNIVPFYGLYEQNGLNFLLERFIDGPTLQDILRQQRGRPLEISDTLIILQALCASLGYAHSMGVVHRDVKPGNVMIDTSGFIYLADFGIAHQSDATTNTASLSGTPAYMAPEQIRGEPPDPRMDIYALGLLLFEMLTGRRPFLGDETGQESSGSASERVRAAHLLLPPPDPRSINPQLSPAIAAVVLKALEKEPARRYASTNDLFLDAAHAAGFAASAAGASEVPNRINLPEILPVQPGVRESARRRAFRRAFPRWTRTCLIAAAAASLTGAVVLALIINQIRNRHPALLPISNTVQTTTPARTLRPASSTPPPAPLASNIVPSVTLQPTNIPQSPAIPPTATHAAATASPVITATVNTPISIPPTGADHQISPKDGMRLIRIPAGPFLMGSDTSPWDFERPQHTVTLDEFWIDQIPVTNAMFAKFVKATGYRTHAEQVGWGYVSPGSGEFQTNGADWKHPNGPGSSITGKEGYPVVQVSWYDAQAYCQWAGRRLLTEAEWEKAARGTDGRLYPWGNEIDCSRANYSNGNKTFCTGGLTAADAYASGASPYGILDMSGNTFDWVADWYQADYYRSAPTKNPQGPASGQKRVHRGGAWYNFDQQVQTSYRFANPPDRSFGSVGIRCGYSQNP